MKKMQFLILLSCIAVAVNAQNNYLLYSFKGNVMVVENNVETKAKVGKSLSGNATLKIPAGAAVTLICNEAAMFTLSKPGSFALKNMGDSCKVGSNSLSANYVKYVWAQMTKSSGAPGSNRKAYMNNVGAVTRSINNIWVDPRLDTVNYSAGDGFPLSWKSYAEAKEFEFFLYSSDNITQPIFKTSVTKLKIPIADFIKKLKPGSTYFWTAAIKGEENEELKMFNYVTKETYAAIESEMKAQGAAFEAPAEQAYRLAFMLEDAHYLAEAYQYYLKAATLDPTNALYRATLMSFKKDYEIK
ncbi:MAG TPA: hypothetical protein VFV31_13415 [Chitinophagaceae bacterium]|nr:hypothetical protein [Chitinophagaceae bacterium]